MLTLHTLIFMGHQTQGHGHNQAKAKAIPHAVMYIGYHVDTLSLAKSDAKAKAIWPSH